MNPSSQKATPSVDKSAAASRAPKRERGRQRVAALIDAASRVIAARGYAAATMTAIAAEAGAAIGSLYQFFPTKAALAEVLLGRYGERLGAALDALSARSGTLTPETLAEGLAAMMLDLTADRAAVMAILDARADTVGARRQLRARFEAGIGRLLRAVRPDVAQDGGGDFLDGFVRGRQPRDALAAHEALGAATSRRQLSRLAYWLPGRRSLRIWARRSGSMGSPVTSSTP